MQDQDTVTPHAMDNSSEDSNNDEYDGIVASKEALLPKGQQHSASVDHEKGGHSIEKRVRKLSEMSRTSSYGESPKSKLENCFRDSDDEISPIRKYVAVGVLFLINLLNYMDRFTIPGVLLKIQNYFDVDNSFMGLLQTVFIMSYMLFAPLFGYLGDRYNRKMVMLVGMVIWCGCTFLASLITDKSQVLVFLALRGLVGIGEASYSTIAPTIIADLFAKSMRTRMLSVFFFAIPVGSGLGFIVGAAAADAAGSWHWALRVTPGFGLLVMVLMMVLIPNPKRGSAEATVEVIQGKDLDNNRSTYIDDLKYILKNRSFVFITIAFTFMAFVVGSLTIWATPFIAYAQVVLGVLKPCIGDECKYSEVAFVFGVITCVAGVLGVFVGAESAKKWKEKGNKNADAHVCAIGLLVSGPLMLITFQLATVNMTSAYILIFFANVSLCSTWTLVSDMTLYVTLPMRRSTAQAVQILTMHLFGDAGSPYLIGVMTDALTAKFPDTFYSKYLALLYSMYIPLFATAFSGGMFLIASLFLQRDKKKVDDYLAGVDKASPSSSTVSTSLSTESGQSAEEKTGNLLDYTSPYHQLAINCECLHMNNSNGHLQSKNYRSENCATLSQRTYYDALPPTRDSPSSPLIEKQQQFNVSDDLLKLNVDPSSIDIKNYRFPEDAFLHKNKIKESLV